MKLPVLAVVTLIACVTVIANSGYGNSLLGFVQVLPGKDLLGHFVLYGGLGFTLFLYLKDRETPSRFLVGFVAALIVAEEFSQMFIGHRTFSLLDLAASLLGYAFGLCAKRIASAACKPRKWFLGLRK